MTQPAQVILIDLDNTLINSNSAHKKSFREVLSLYDKSLLQFFQYESYKGLPTLDVFHKIGIPINEIPKLITLKSEHYRHCVELGEVRLFPGALEFLKKKQSQGHHIILNTSASSQSVECVLNKLFSSFSFTDLFVSGDFNFDKHQEMYWVNLYSLLQTKYETIIVIDDSIQVLEQVRRLDKNNLLLLDHERQHTNLKLSGIRKFFNFKDLGDFMDAL